MSEPEVRLHDVSVSGDVDHAAVLAAIERAVARTCSPAAPPAAGGAPTPEAVRAALRRSVAEASRR